MTEMLITALNTYIRTPPQTDGYPILFMDSKGLRQVVVYCHLYLKYVYNKETFLTVKHKCAGMETDWTTQV